MIDKLACAVASRVTRILAAPLFILLFPLGCALFVAAGWIAGQLSLALLILTTMLSVLASWQASMVMLVQRHPEKVG